MDALPLVGKSAIIAITNYMVHLTKEERVEHICFLLVLRATETHSLPKTFKDVTKLQANSKKRWLESCLKELKSLKDRDIYEIMDLSKRRKAVKNCWMFNISLIAVIDLLLLLKDFFKLKASTLMNYSLQLFVMKLYDYFLELLHLRIWIFKALISK